MADRKIEFLLIAKDQASKAIGAVASDALLRGLREFIFADQLPA